MEKYFGPCTRLPEARFTRRWTRMTTEIKGKMPLSFRRDASILFHDSLAELGVFEHDYIFQPQKCASALALVDDPANSSTSFSRKGISGLDFDTEGIYLASITKAGCLIVHEFETLYCAIYGPKSSQLVNGTKEFIHISVGQALDSVRWNPINQDEVACATRENHHICLINIFHFSSKEAQVLCSQKDHTMEHANGLSEVLFASDDKSRLFASGLDGNVYVWDTRLSNHPCLTLTTNSRRELNSIALYQDQVVLGADKCGFIHSWDIRGGQSSHAFQSHNQRSLYPSISIKLSAELEKISSLKAQTDILPKEIHSISINPSCSRQLAFHLVDGWSGVLDLSDLVVTHVHCPPAVLDGTVISTKSIIRRPSWFPTFSTYAVGSVADKGLYLLDFFPGKHSACHVDFDPESRSNSPDCSRIPENKYIPVSENILACAIHPHNDTIIAGTKESSLMVISQKHKVDNGD
ncbi:uncharacterized protein LOC122000397 [Zingiber officinale]|uniref:uncharacterized protein LOC122000397 n=1 Tax=Zingiber officinale TaxID=94328 RepID=UPI001C4B9223|nr:uncharacterized protein LOC122000397 [Zingiber officinale]